MRRQLVLAALVTTLTVASGCATQQQSPRSNASFTHEATHTVSIRADGIVGEIEYKAGILRSGVEYPCVVTLTNETTRSVTLENRGSGYVDLQARDSSGSVVYDSESQSSADTYIGGRLVILTLDPLDPGESFVESMTFTLPAPGRYTLEARYAIRFQETSEPLASYPGAPSGPFVDESLRTQVVAD